MARAPRFDPLAASPYLSYAALRREAPVHRVPGAGYFVVSRLADVRAVAQRPDLFSSQLFSPRVASAPGSDPMRRSDALPAMPVREGGRPRPGLVSGMVRDVAVRGAERPLVLATADPPLHTRQRRVVSQACGFGRAAELEGRVRSMVGALIDDLGPDRHVEWMSRFALRLPLAVMVDLLGLPPDDGPRLKQWTDHAVASVTTANSPAAIRAHARAWAELEGYLTARLAAAASEPHMLGALARVTGDGPESISSSEAVGALIQLLVGGNESTSSLLGSAALLLSGHPDVEARLRRDAAAIPAFVEEVLRLESPFQSHVRVATRDTEIAGVAIPAGALVMLLWGAANRDETSYARPDAIDLDRESPKDHVAFGEGIHYCLGAALARLETRVTVEELLARYAPLRLAPGHRPTYLRSMFLRRPATVELVLERSSRVPRR